LLEKYGVKLLKIIIPITILIIIGIIFGITQQEINTDSTEQMPTSSEIDLLLEEVRNEKITNDESDQPFIPELRTWPTSGPFKIDRSEYRLGEKIFVNIDELGITDKGEVVVLRPINSTDHIKYHVMPFDGTAERNNYYFTPDLSELRGICSVDELIGDWKIKFLGTNYQDLEFKVTEKIIPGFEERYQTIVNKGKC
jgi:hypothetical protein